MNNNNIINNNNIMMSNQMLGLNLMNNNDEEWPKGFKMKIEEENEEEYDNSPKINIIFKKFLRNQKKCANFAPD